MQKIIIFLCACFFSCLAADQVASGLDLSSLGKTTIVIDAGHGGTNRGACAHSPFCEEKRICLRTSLLVKKYLDQLGYHVVMTRGNDVFISLPHRVQIAKRSGASLFVSIHYNSAPTPLAKGVEVFYHASGKKRSLASKRLAEAVLSQVVKRTSSPSRGVKKGNFFVLRETPMPAILVEGGFITHPEERKKLRDPKYLDKIARGIADGIDRYYRGKK